MGIGRFKALGLAAALLAVGASWAAPAVASDLKARASAPLTPTAEADALGVRIAHLIFTALDLKTLFAKEMQSSGDLDTFAKFRPNWPRFMAEAAAEEVAQKLPQIEGLMGRVMASYFTVEEMRAGVAILSDPGMVGFIQKAMADDSFKLDTRALTPATRKAMSSAAGQRFSDKFSRIDEPLESIDGEVAVLIIPGFMRRFADKVDAEEAARKATP